MSATIYKHCPHLKDGEDGWTMPILQNAGVDSAMCEICLAKAQIDLHRQHTEQIAEQNPRIEIKKIAFKGVVE